MVVVTVLAGCSYSPGSILVSHGGRMICAREVPLTAGDLQAVFDTRGPWWSGGDGGFAVDLPEGRRLWLFGDTVVGQVHHRSRRYVDNRAMVNNSMLVQSGRCFEVRMHGPTSGPTRSALEHPDRSRVWWPLSGVFDPVRGRVMVFALRQDSSNWWINHGMDLIELSWPELEVTGHQLLSLWTERGFPAVGTTVLVDGSWLYAYGAPLTGMIKPGHVARTRWPLSDHVSFEHFDGTGWTADITASVPMTTSEGPALGVFHPHKVHDGYVAVSKPYDGVDGTVSQWWSASVHGPWQWVGNVDLPRYSGTGWVYGARTYQLPNGHWVLLRSENPTTLEELHDDVLRYGVKVSSWIPPVARGVARSGS